MSTWTLDSPHTVVSLSAKHMMITRVRGTFSGVRGTIELDEADPTRSTVVVSIPAASIATGMEARDNHLRSADFLDAERYPTIEFASRRVERNGDRFRITGDLTIRGTTRPVVLDAARLGIVRNMKGGRHAGFEAKATIRRSEWGLTWNVGLETGGWLVSDDVSIDLEVAADEVAQAVSNAA